ncbi:T9SS type A sorting domain-containing protein [Aquimarina sp. 2304DJ70-9]|uniref:T9SS type A sorting domain-containing protein n=1 Tax=Aquimarina penaris TaxID=3231044 RepID=UPI003462BFEE
MPKITLVFFLILTSLTVYAQEVISTQGDSYANESASVDFTIGEVVINTLTDGTNDITQGFHQTNWKFVDLEDHTPSFEVIIFPNPTEDILNIQTSSFENVTYSIYDALGKLVLQDKLSAELTPVSTSHLASGLYSVTLNTKGKKLKTFKLAKIL